MKRINNLNVLKRPLFLCLLAVLAIFTTSCTEEDFTSPTVIISSPNEGDAFTVDDNIEIIGRATDDTALQNVNILSNLGIDRNLTDFSNSTDFPFNISLEPDPATVPGEYSIVLLATDTSGNTDEETVIIEIQ